MESKFYFIRHSISTYQNMRDVIEGSLPEGRVDYHNQNHDIPPAGVELAKKKAGEFLDRLDPEVDVLYLVSSNEARAIDTGNIYRKEAKERGFKAVFHRKCGNQYAEEVSSSEIRVLKSLSLNPPSCLFLSIYNPVPEKAFRPNWDLVREETQAVWQAARAVIENDNRGSWAGNFAAHSPSVVKILRTVSPHEKSSEDLHQENFQDLLRMARLACRRIEEKCPDVVVLAFGHENYLMVALEKYFGEHGIGNCESIKFTVSNSGTVTMKFRGKEAVIE